MTPDIRGILKDLQKKTQALMLSMPYDLIEEEILITQALTAIDLAYKKWFMEMVGEDEKAKYIDSPEAIEYNNRCCLISEGRNTIRQEIKENYEEKK